MATPTGRAIMLLGSSGSGKGTQARLLQLRLGMTHLDFGQARRTAVDNNTPAGRQISALGDLVSRGKFLDDDLVTEIFLEALRAQRATGADSFVLDGFPRNLEQLRRLRKELRLDLGVVLRAPFETLLRRIDGRLIHRPSGRTYHPTENPPAATMRDDVTGEPLEPRFISTTMGPEEALRARCDIEARETAPLIEALEREGLIEQVDASASAEAVHAEIVRLISASLPAVHNSSCTEPRATTRRALPQTVLQTYRTKGFVAVEGVLDGGWVERLRGAVGEVTASSASGGSTEAFDVDDGHSPTTPTLRKIKRPHLWHPAFAAVSHDPALLSVVEQLLGAGSEGSGSRGVRWQGDKVVIKAAHVGKHVVCHQDWAFYPHTNDDLCTVSVVLEPMTLAGGGLCFLPGSHRGPLYSHHDATGQFIGGIADPAFAANSLAWEAVECPPGTLVVHHVRTVHCSPPNRSATPRPLLLLQFAAADAWPLQQHARGAWGLDLPPRHALDDWALYCRSVLRGPPSPHPRLAAVPASVAAPWPGRGARGALFSQLAQVGPTSSLDTAVAHIATTRPAASLVDTAAAMPMPPQAGPTPASGAQFASLWARSLSSAGGASSEDRLEWQRLLHLVGAGPYGSLYRFGKMRRQLQAALVGAVQAEGADDDDVYDAIHDCFHREIVGSTEQQAAAQWSGGERSEQRAEEVVALFRQSASVEAEAGACSVLDVGCADGAITAAVGRRLGLPASSVHGCDLRDEMLVGSEQTHAGMTFTQLARQTNALSWSDTRPLLPYADESFDLVYTLMTLHHVRRLKHLLDDVRRVLKPGGVLVLREHDCISPANAAVLDIMHGLHHRAWAPDSHPNYRARGWVAANYRGWYQSAEAWNMGVTAAGLAPHPLMGPRLRPGGDAEEVWLRDDDAASVLPAAQLERVLLRGSREQQLVHFANPKRVVFGVYYK